MIKEKRQNNKKVPSIRANFKSLRLCFATTQQNTKSKQKRLRSKYASFSSTLNSLHETFIKLHVILTIKSGSKGIHRQ